MIHRLITDWDDAYANFPHIPRSERWPGAWTEAAEAFRAMLASDNRARLDLSYGDRPRNRLDLFLPKGTARGLVVFIHGGFWRAFDKSMWSHLAAGSLDSGFAVAMPSYTLCPEVRVRDITGEIGQAIVMAAREVDGPILMSGHSAGGHLATRMITTTTPLPAEVLERVTNTVSISGVHDLRPLLNTALNRNEIRLDAGEADAESPALLTPVAGARLTCWAGGGERAEFIRQNALLANIWTGLGAETAEVVEADRHHFNVVDGLTDAGHPLTRALLGT